MDSTTLQKKLSTYVSEKGQLRNVSEELLFEILSAWENWAGTAKSFYKEIGFSQRQMACIIGKAKKLKRKGYFGDAGFKEVQPPQELTAHSSGGHLIEVTLKDGKLIRFPHVDQLLEFMKKAS
jgi:hypothetical protein